VTAPVLSDIQARLTEAEEALRAIRHGEVDALVVQDATPEAQVFTLASADRPYRMFVENMRDGAATVSEAGTVLYANRRLAELLARPLHQIIGAPIASFLANGYGPGLDLIKGPDGGTIELELLTSADEHIPVRANGSSLDVDLKRLLCLTFADLTQQNAQMLEIENLGQAQAERMVELQQAQAALTRQATHDALTGLPNRNLLIDRIQQALATAERSHTAIGLIFVDLDGFKQINDTRGHAAGDSVLSQIADRLQTAVRPMDSVCRLGGDEFVVLLPALISSMNAINVATRIAAEFDSPVKLDHGAVTVTASIGISVCDPATLEGDLDPNHLIQQADTAMYHAKSLGGMQAQLFDATSTPNVLEADRETWVTRIHEALDEDRLVLYSQPIVDLPTGRVVQQELLLRLHERDGQLIPPMTFLPTAERCGLIGVIDQWVIKQGVKLAAQGQSVSVNLSATSVGDPVVLELIEQELRRHGTDPGHMVFEITETAVMENIDRGRTFAERLDALGCRIALDDFGTGFASFTYLKRFPVEYLKIDIEFVRDLIHSERDRSVVSAIVALASGFGQQTIAEGVENQETADLLGKLGVNFAQGYLFGRPTAL
jgi:diguanylate cyclase (GGDEF)-like protein